MITLIASLIFLLFLVITIISSINGAPYVGINKKGLEEIKIILGNNLRGKKIVDLGSGDGRILTTVCQSGTLGVGFEINPILVLISRYRIKFLGMEDRIRIFWGSFWREDLGKYDLITVYGVPYIMHRLKKKLVKDAKKNSVIVSYAYKIPGMRLKRSIGNTYLYIQ